MKLQTNTLSLSKLHALAAGGLAVMIATGCAADAAESASPAEPTAAVGDLTLDTNEHDRTAGRFARDGVVLSFDFAREQASHTATLRSGDGRHLVTSVLAGGIETTRIFDGRLVVSGAPQDAEPKFEGQRSELEAVMKDPAMKLLSDLRVALEAKGIDRDLQLPLGHSTTAGAVTPQKYFSGWDGYWHLGPGEQQALPTWSFWYPTYVYLRNFGSRCATATLWHTGPEPVIVPANGYTSRERYYWGFAVTVENMNAWIDWSYLGYGVCGPSEIGAISR